MIWKVKCFFQVSYEKLQSLHPGQYFPLLTSWVFCCRSKFPHSWWLKTTQAYYLTVPAITSPTQVSPGDRKCIPSWKLQAGSWCPAQSGVSKIRFHRIVRWFWWSAQNFPGPWSLHIAPYISEPVVQWDLGPFSPCIISSPLLLLSSMCKDWAHSDN